MISENVTNHLNVSFFFLSFGFALLFFSSLLFDVLMMCIHLGISCRVVLSILKIGEHLTLWTKKQFSKWNMQKWHYEMLFSNPLHSIFVWIICNIWKWCQICLLSNVQCEIWLYFKINFQLQIYFAFQFHKNSVLSKIERPSFDSR